MLNIGPQELLLVLVVALLVVGPRRLPELGRSLGKGLREIRKAQSEVRKTIQIELDDEPTPASPSGRGSSARLPKEASGDGVAEQGADGVLPAAAATAQTSTVGEVSKTLGRSLAELRKARQEIQRSFRVDLDEPGVTASSSTAASPRTPVAESTPPVSDPPADEPDGTVAPDAGPAPE